MGNEHPEAPLSQEPPHATEQQTVHKTAAGERNGIESAFAGDVDGGIGKACRHGIVCLPSQEVRICAGGDAVQYGAEKRSWIQDPASQRQGDSRGLRADCRPPRRSFELDGGFSLIGCLVADAEQGGQRIEKAPHAAGEGAVDTTLYHGGGHLARGLIHAFKEARRPGMVEQPVSHEQRICVAPGIAHRGRAAGETPSCKVGGALKAG